MREIRPSGSEGGESELNRFSLPLSRALSARLCPSAISAICDSAISAHSR